MRFQIFSFAVFMCVIQHETRSMLLNAMHENEKKEKNCFADSSSKWNGLLHKQLTFHKTRLCFWSIGTLSWNSKLFFTQRDSISFREKYIHKFVLNYGRFFGSVFLSYGSFYDFKNIEWIKAIFFNFSRNLLHEKKHMRELV